MENYEEKIYFLKNLSVYFGYNKELHQVAKILAEFIGDSENLCLELKTKINELETKINDNKINQ